MRILMIANYVSFPWEIGNCRFVYLLNKLSNEKNKVELITTEFFHIKKRKRSIEKELPYKVTLIKEPGYNKNISIKRLYSSFVLGKNLKSYLKNLDYKPDVIYCSVPSIEFAFEAARYAKKNKIKFVIDVQDLWPEAFKMKINIPILSDILFYPLMKRVDYIYSNADEIVAVSETYANRALKVNTKVNKTENVFLGTDLEKFDKYKVQNRIEYSDNMIRIVYAGTLGHSYDIKYVIDSIKILNVKGYDNIKFIVIGDGPLKSSFAEYAKKKLVDCEFVGRIDYQKMVGLLSSCDIAVNPITHGSAASIINKHADYAAAGLPVLNSQECLEYRNLVDEYEMGINCNNNDAKDFAKNLIRLINNQEVRKTMGQNARKCAEEKFDRNMTYDIIMDLINKDRR